MAVRVGPYKAHYWTWTNPLAEYMLVCGGVGVGAYVHGV